MVDALQGAIVQRDGKSYAIVPRTPLGLVTPDTLETIARVARKYEVPILKITSGQRMAMVGIKPEMVAEIWQELGMEVGPAVEVCVHFVQACPGITLCRFGIQDSLDLGMRLETLFVGKDMPAKVKIGVSGCTLNCGASYVRDFGAFGKKSGWTVVFGGNAGAKPRIGDIIGENLSADEVVNLARLSFEYYTDQAKKKERTARFIERVGIDAFKRAVLY